jgi:uncharacterized protein (TIGR03067 family)
MRKLLLTVFLTLLSSPVFAQAPAPAPATPETVKPLTGHYKPESITFDGKQQIPNPKAAEPLTLVIQNNEYRAYYQPNLAEDKHFRLFTADIIVDEASKTFTLFVKDGAKKGEKRHGIFTLSGGVLTLCYGPAEKPRPTSFAAPDGSEYFLEVWRATKR